MDIITRIITTALFHLYGVLNQNLALTLTILGAAAWVFTLPSQNAYHRSQRKMQQLAPKLNDLQIKYRSGGNRLVQEQVKLYQQHGVNPVSGCLSLLLIIAVLVILLSGVSATLTTLHTLTPETWSTFQPNLLVPVSELNFPVDNQFSQWDLTVPPPDYVPVAVFIFTAVYLALAIWQGQWWIAGVVSVAIALQLRGAPSGMTLLWFVWLGLEILHATFFRGGLARIATWIAPARRRQAAVQAALRQSTVDAQQLDRLRARLMRSPALKPEDIDLFYRLVNLGANSIPETDADNFVLHLTKALRDLTQTAQAKGITSLNMTGVYLRAAQVCKNLGHDTLVRDLSTDGWECPLGSAQSKQACVLLLIGTRALTDRAKSAYRLFLATESSASPPIIFSDRIQRFARLPVLPTNFTSGRYRPTGHERP